ncbi:winged helix-turn-helix transcriptional regulator [Brachybacterium saurashtrense]|uniref:Transcriptional regulator n=1 Tax=Brachybacterium saurashtrense TaxID=556288 RepID=A0A345YP70_9MICO|nr:helix-turn-helix domain-containing protein [Brachybacterium saurashtrense]AXK45722.1 transcriptional regulator [Brachybacterium saurashtrense]RRR24740.1 transcriptional regulator [Brachybacterium saurashtrense]
MPLPPPYDPYVRDCPSRRLLDRIGDRWTVLLIAALEGGPQRFSQLLRTVEGISQKMLTQTLRSLEADGLVHRTVHPEIPPRVEYELTALGRSLLAPLGALIDWATEHMGEVQSSRDAVDAR